MGAALRTPQQNRRLWGVVAALRRAAALSEDDAAELVRERCRALSGQEHTSRLTAVQAHRLILDLEREVAGYAPTESARNRKPARAPWGPRGPGLREDQPITRRQQEVVTLLYEQLGWDLQRQRGFNQRQTRRPWPQTQKDADAVIEGLTAILLRQVRWAEALARAEALLGHPALDAWQRRFLPDLVQQFRSSQRPERVLTPHKLRKLVEAEARVAGGAGGEE